MKIETLPINSLQLDPDNARKHDSKNIQALAKSLKKFGQRKPIVINVIGQVVAGNGTLAAAQSLGWKEIDVVRLPADWTPEMIRAYAIADNRTAELSEFDRIILTEQLVELKESDFDLEALGFTEIELENFTRINSAEVLGSTDAFREWAGMPEYNQDNKHSVFHCTVHFASEEDVKDFFEILQIKKGKSVWWPEHDGLIGSNINEQYVIDDE